MAHAIFLNVDISKLDFINAVNESDRIQVRVLEDTILILVSTPPPAFDLLPPLFSDKL